MLQDFIKNFILVEEKRKAKFSFLSITQRFVLFHDNSFYIILVCFLCNHRNITISTTGEISICYTLHTSKISVSFKYWTLAIKGQTLFTWGFLVLASSNFTITECNLVNSIPVAGPIHVFSNMWDDDLCKINIWSPTLKVISLDERM